MNLNDLHQQLQQNPEYKAAEEELRLHFELANAVLRARLAKGWSQGELAQKIGTKQANISRIEAGLANPTLTLIQKILKVLDLDLSIYPSRKETTFLSIDPEFIFQPNTQPVKNNSYLISKNWPISSCEPQFATNTIISENAERR
jgi:transcriptional regulator with XRE-family HTH domain